MTPPQLHISRELESNTGTPPTRQDTTPSIHGETINGMQGAIPVVAVAGLVGLRHIANGIIFTIDTLSIIVAIGVGIINFRVGKTTILLGAVPKLHINCPPLQTQKPICLSSFLCRYIYIYFHS